MNLLYYGDNLDVLRRHVADESVDLVYLDPPFNSNASYNILFAEHGTKAAAQIKAFEDTWTWDENAARSYQEVVESTGGGKCPKLCVRFAPYNSAWSKDPYPKLQIVTVGELLDGRRINMPPVRQTSVTYKRAPKAQSKAAEQPRIFGED